MKSLIIILIALVSFKIAKSQELLAPGAQAFASERIQNLLSESNQTLARLFAHYPDSNVMDWAEADRELYFRARATKIVILFAPDLYSEHLEVSRLSFRIFQSQYLDARRKDFAKSTQDREVDTDLLVHFAKRFEREENELEMRCDEPYYRVYFFSNSPNHHPYYDMVLADAIIQFDKAGQPWFFCTSLINHGLHFVFPEREDKRYKRWMEEHQMIYSDYLRMTYMEDLILSKEWRRILIERNEDIMSF